MSDELKTHDSQRGITQTVLKGIVWVSEIAAWLIIPIVFLVGLSVLASLLDIGKIAEWKDDILLFGSRLTSASLGDLQWHLFGLMLMLTIAGGLVTDSHVRVDFIRQNMSSRTKRIVDTIGHIIFLLPFCYVVVDLGIDSTARALRIDEGSDYDGLYDRFLIKSTIPIGFALLMAAGVFLIIKNIKRLIKPNQSEGK
ncbi:TRAP transporter small permease subunit [Enterovibrio makurazakiensis]|uniref:TRAP transporter small permease protein n=1 Tax=Enterovibrio gelatinilyticus TaxID=2899819 RepID=A0ABT5R1A6_9GAMM|nr:TRAP transporter small permease subunit [Enterovibrio sp. ZSDZ42]MDD1794057.1 TRAP transporter small permease subunit [Enterovibrio sp. ZSDZ42]